MNLIAGGAAELLGAALPGLRGPAALAVFLLSALAESGREAGAFRPLAVGPVRVVHQVRGRLRLELAGFRPRRGELASLEQAVRRLDGVRSAELNPLTGRLLVQFDPGQICPERLVREVALRWRRCGETGQAEG